MTQDRTAKPWDAHIQALEPPMNEKDARIKECLVIIRLLYDEHVVNNLNTKGRQIAGRFLYSQGYQELKTIVESHL